MDTLSNAPHSVSESLTHSLTHQALKRSLLDEFKQAAFTQLEHVAQRGGRYAHLVVIRGED